QRRDAARGNVPRTRGGNRPACRACRSARGDAWLATLPLAEPVCASQRPPDLRRPEAGVVPAATGRRRAARPARRKRTSRVRSLALGRFLVPEPPRRLIQAARLRTGAAPPRTAGRGELPDFAARPAHRRERGFTGSRR